MFVSKEHHPQTLSPAAYCSQQHFDRELARIFLPTWHCVAAKAELPRDGDFKTLDLLGRPLLIRRDAGQHRAYLNVCSHRYCLLTHADRGRMPTLRCQYHGWEYDASGDTRRIPESKTFRPLAPGVLGLTTFRTETCGQLIFVNLSDRGPSLREHLGDAFERMERWFHDGLAFVGSKLRDVPANWKVVVENGIESYHLTELHGKTFGENPLEEKCTHALTDRWTGLNVNYHGDKSAMIRLDDLAHKWVGATPRHEYDHLHYFPNFMPGRLSVNVWLESILPVSPNRTHNLGISFCYAGNPQSVWTPWRAMCIRHWAKNWHTKVSGEDQPVIAAMQRGLASADHPRGGLISTREERIFHFQEYIVRETGCERFDGALEDLAGGAHPAHREAASRK